MLFKRIQKDLRDAQLGRDGVRVSTLRMLLSEVKNAQIASLGATLGDGQVVSVVRREMKKRREAAASFRLGGREDQAKREELEANILGEYLPKMLSHQELTKIVLDIINEVGADSLKDFGKVMGLVMARVEGQAEGGEVSSIVRKSLS